MTVTYRDPSGLQRTVDSVTGILHEADGAVEIVVVDGGVSDDTPSILAPVAGRSRLIAEPDAGIYDAMNKGIHSSRGEYIWFLNGGDEALASWSALRAMLRNASGRMIYCAFQLHTGTRTIDRSARRPSSIWHALPTSHQAIFYPAEATRSSRYPTGYDIAADYAFTAGLVAHGVGAVTVPLTVARFHLDGVSASNGKVIREEAARVQRDVLNVSAPRRLVSAARHRAAALYRSTLLAGRGSDDGS